MEYVWLALAVAVMVFLAWVGFRIEPHWVSKDRSRFICNAQLLTEQGEPVGRFRETKILVEPTGELLVDQRKLFRRRMSAWRLVAESDDPPRRRAVFLLRGHDAQHRPAMLAVRVPATSPIVPTLRDIADRRGSDR
ncbi:MAG: hypothetical protein KDB40_12525 [Acidimicrobiales bacterium]|nr:hypothetical protein [Acidimicrobiales bacterium]MCB9394336.1 hypothetical protein [Acidimicrobiaceae bacterium]